MDARTFFDNFETLAEAPGGVVKLRELILELAVRGRLVPQDPSDEPASVLLERIAAEKARLVKEGKLKKQEALPPVREDQVPFEVPGGWEWCSLGELCRFIDYRGNTPTKTESGIRLITAKNVRMGFIKEEPREYVSPATYDEWMTRGFPRRGDVLFTTEAPLGNVAELQFDEKFALAQRVINLQPHSDFLGRCLMYLLMSSCLQYSIRDQASGMTATGIKAARLKCIPIPVPPLPEQHRIVARVDELMALCDQLEARQTRRQTLRKALQASALDALATADSLDALASAWARVHTHLDAITGHPDSIAPLRQTILELAVRGKLVQQDPTDEPASVLLECIAAEKARLVKEGNVKKKISTAEARRRGDQEPSFSCSSPSPRLRASAGENIATGDHRLGAAQAGMMSTGEFPFELPLGWEWCRLGEVGLIGTGATPPKGETKYYENGMVPWITSGATSQAAILSADDHVTELAVQECRLRIYPPGSLVVALYGQGKTRGQVSQLRIPAAVNQACAVITFPDTCKKLCDFVLVVLRGKYEEFRALAAGGAQPNINLGIVERIVVPLPPFAEQHRIVARVDALMALCDQLEARLKQQQEKAAALVASAVHSVLAI